MAELEDALDSGSSGPKSPCGFKSRLPHHFHFHILRLLNYDKFILVYYLLLFVQLQDLLLNLPSQTSLK